MFLYSNKIKYTHFKKIQYSIIIVLVVDLHVRGFRLIFLNLYIYIYIYNKV
jgi:hypothetical protein